MDHRIPKLGAAISVMLAVGALITFVFLNRKFEGPDPIDLVKSAYELEARFDDAATLPSKQAVLHKGVSVGRVSAVDYDPEAQEAVVRFTLDDEIVPIYRDASVQIGERSLLGDAYLNLVDRGNAEAGELASGDEVTQTLPEVRFDEAFDFLDKRGRDAARSLLSTLGEAGSRPGNGRRANATIGGLNRTIAELHALTGELTGQEESIAAIVSDTATVLDEISAREDAVRSVVASGRVTVDALAANTDSLGQAIEELPRLLAAGRKTLADADPLLIEARPVINQLAELAPDLRAAFGAGAPFSVGPLSIDLADLVELLPAQRRALERVAPRVVRLNRKLVPLVRLAGPAALNTVPIADYLAPRIDSFGAFFSSGAGVVAHGDEVGRYGRFGLISDPALLADTPNDGNCDRTTGLPTVPGPGYCYNAYPAPGDSLDNRPFDGSYPRLRPYRPPDRNSLSHR